MAIGLLGKYSSQSATEPFEVISPPIVSGLFYPTKPLEENDPNDDTGLPSEGVTLKNVDNVTVSISQDGNNLSFTDGSNTNSSVDISSSDYHLYTTTSLTQESDYIDLGYVSNLGQWSDTSNVDNKYSFYGDRFYVISGTSPNPNADIVQTNTTHNYIGDVYGQIGTQPSTTWTAPEMASGTFSAQVNFGSSSIDFSYIDMSSTSYEASISSQSASINSNLTFSADNVTGQVGPTGSMATGTASIHGSFFGSDNSGIGGEFHIITTTSPYYAGGAFIGKSGQ